MVPLVNIKQTADRNPKAGLLDTSRRKAQPVLRCDYTERHAYQYSMRPIRIIPHPRWLDVFDVGVRAEHGSALANMLAGSDRKRLHVGVLRL